MHDTLYENQRDWDRLGAQQRGAVFEGYARDIGLDIEKYRADLDSDAVRQKIERDRALARKVQADSTPTFILNGRELPAEEWYGFEALNKTVRTALTEAGVALDEDTPAAP